MLKVTRVHASRRLGLEADEDAASEMVMFAAAVHGALDRLEAVDRALNAALAPRERCAVGDGVQVLADAVGEGLAFGDACVGRPTRQ